MKTETDCFRSVRISRFVVNFMELINFLFKTMSSTILKPYKCNAYA